IVGEVLVELFGKSQQVDHLMRGHDQPSFVYVPSYMIRSLAVLSRLLLARGRVSAHGRQDGGYGSRRIFLDFSARGC
ncbi:MAG TPA: hypothetical protein PKL84_03210, partial [Candidatus Hydrogenedentes bacterium]|nr:hypothetical protein [Candidatus Hydrogenedentota bacterium]